MFEDHGLTPEEIAATYDDITDLEYARMDALADLLGRVALESGDVECLLASSVARLEGTTTQPQLIMPSGKVDDHLDRIETAAATVDDTDGVRTKILASVLGLRDAFNRRGRYLHAAWRLDTEGVLWAARPPKQRSQGLAPSEEWPTGYDGLLQLRQDFANLGDDLFEAVFNAKVPPGGARVRARHGDSRGMAWTPKLRAPLPPLVEPPTT